MIYAELLTVDGRAAGFKIKGHAGYAQSGSDIVCSAVSAVAQTALIGLIEVVGVKTDYSIDESGKMDCMVTDSDSEKQKQAQLLLKVMYAGLCSIQVNYGKYLRVSEREVTTNV